MKIYISSENREIARDLATNFENLGYDVVSTWHVGEQEKFWHYTPTVKTRMIRRNDKEIRSADILLMTTCSYHVPGGKFVEAGIALGAGKQVVVYGERDNIVLYHPDVYATYCWSEVIKYLAELDKKYKDPWYRSLLAIKLWPDWKKAFLAPGDITTLNQPVDNSDPTHSL